MDTVALEHQMNENKLAALEKEVDRVTSPSSLSVASSSSKLESSPSPGPQPASPKKSGNSASPSSIAASLFTRSKPKSKSKSKSKNARSSAQSTPSSQLNNLEDQVKRTKEDELKLVSSAIGIAEDNAVINEQGDDDVLDLADRLLEQLDAKKQEDGQGDISIPASGTASSENTAISHPQPIPGTSSSSLSVPNGGYSSGTPLSQSTSTQSLSRGSSLGQKIKKALSPDSFGESTLGFTANGLPKNRHQIRKEKKKAQEDAMRAEAQAELDAATQNGRKDPALVEKEAFDRIGKQWNLEMVEMEPDGHCMYSAVADQLIIRRHLKKASYLDTRKAAASYMRSHIDDFLPFMPAEDEDGEGEGILSPEGYAKHCENVETTGEWGGQTEILALSKHYQVPIYVYQANSPIVRVGQEESYAKSKIPLTISYHRHQYGLGQHYNSLRPIPPQHGIVMLSG